MIAFLVIIFGSLAVTAWYERRLDDGTDDKAYIRKMADDNQKTARKPRKQRYTKYSKIGWTPKRTGGRK